MRLAIDLKPGSNHAVNSTSQGGSIHTSAVVIPTRASDATLSSTLEARTPVSRIRSTSVSVLRGGRLVSPRTMLIHAIAIASTQIVNSTSAKLRPRHVNREKVPAERGVAESDTPGAGSGGVTHFLCFASVLAIADLRAQADIMHCIASSRT